MSSSSDSEEEEHVGTKITYDPDLGVHGAPHCDIVTDLSDLHKVIPLRSWIYR
jgi:hypothetical protein